MFNQKDIEMVASYMRQLHIPEHFGDADETAVESMDIYNLIGELHNIGCPAFHVFHGVSKVVINFKDLPFVVKIPFNGMWYYDYEVDDGETNVFEPFMCAAEEDPTDYCLDELSKIDEATFFGYGQFFPQMMYLGEFNGHQFYLQEKVIPMDEADHNEDLKEESLNSASSLKRGYARGFEEEWLATVIEKYGVDCWINFVDWVKSTEPEIFEDVHAANYGFGLDGRPVMFDVSGFRD